MKEFKKGDWVVFPKFNNFPVQLKQDGKWGTFYRLLTGDRFFPDKPLKDVTSVYAIHDHRDHLIEGEGWSIVGSSEQFPVRKATTADLVRLKKALFTQAEALEKQAAKIRADIRKIR